ncbi:LysR family transcriptional regulator [Bordetella petrii]|uniref:LysR family transcriptional regulator n=1 Tax=Bordetella petrii TaxID=94624 RepID=UPI001E5C64A9|nr:LysR family transcriptional regulator [Bordetella petrii]MCD0502279.1 LysR family transcriptional regulator [Bordetella petrii]
MDRFEEMRVFTAVVEAGSFVKAAETLRMSKAGVSRHLTELESRLGARLLQRTTRRQSLTEEGQLFYERCKMLLAEVEAAETEVNRHSGEVGGLLRINAPLTFGVLHLAPLWPVFKAQHPRLALDITLSDRVVDLVDEGYDVAVRIAQLTDSSLVSRRFATTRMVLCATRQYLQRHGTPVHPRELSLHTVIAYSYWAGRDEWVFQGPDGGDVAVRVQPMMRANNGDTCVAAALAHLGIILQPSFMIGDQLRDGSLVEVLPQYHSAELGIYGVYPTRRHVPSRVRALVDFLADHFAQPPWPA